MNYQLSLARRDPPYPFEPSWSFGRLQRATEEVSEGSGPLPLFSGLSQVRFRARRAQRQPITHHEWASSSFAAAFGNAFEVGEPSLSRRVARRAPVPPGRK